jgi:hypothetical protein
VGQWEGYFSVKFKEIQDFSMDVKQVNNSQYQELELEEGGHWGPQSVFCVKYMCDIEGIDNCRLESMMVWIVCFMEGRVID